MKCFRYDLGVEYTSNDFVGLFKLDETIHQTSCMDILQQNEAVLTATYVINRYPTAHNSSLSPFEKLYGTLSDYSSLRVFGYTCFVLKPHVKRTKLSSKSTLCVNLGYGSEHAPYNLIPTSSHYLTESEIIKLDPFNDDIEQALQEIPTYTTIETSPITIVTPPHPTTTQSSTKVVVGPPPSGRPKRNCKSTKTNDFIYSCYSNFFSSFIAFVHRLHKPLSYREAVFGSLWQVAIAEELAALHQT
ncbi:gag-pol polyprotein [Tanacetum coccineum]